MFFFNVCKTKKGENMRVRVKYSKQGLMRFIGHLDMMRYFQKACRRAGIDVVYTEGLSPHMSMSFALPLGVGMTSDSEYVDVDLVDDTLSGVEIVRRLNESVPEGVHFLDARQIPVGKAYKGMTLAARADYTLRMNSMDSWDDDWNNGFMMWLTQPEILVLKKGKKTEKEINIRPLIYEENYDGEKLTLGLSAGLDRNIRPELVMRAFAEASGREYRPTLFSINRDEVFADLGKGMQHRFAALIELGDVIS